MKEQNRGGRASRRLLSAGNAYRTWCRVRDKTFSLAISSSFGSFGRDSLIQLPCRLVGEERVAIGDRVFVGSNSWLQVIDSESVDTAIEIGDGTSISGQCVISAVRSIRLHSGVLLARNVYISDHSHAYQDVSRPVMSQGVDKVAPVEIGEGAWLGQNTVVMPGVRIGKGTVVGANSVVTTDIPDYSVAAGAPCRIIKHFGTAS
jgi:acetyltransferase-like isoleucine patch superfamily enzyme